MEGDGWMDSKAGKLKDLPTLVGTKSPVIPRGGEITALIGVTNSFQATIYNDGLGDPHL